MLRLIQRACLADLFIMSSTSSSPNPIKPTYRFHMWGVPYGKEDVAKAVDSIYNLYWEAMGDHNIAMQHLLDKNEKVVSRCGMLMTFSGILIAVALFILNNLRDVLAPWQKAGFYIMICIWLVSTILLLWSLKHKLPSAKVFHKEDDFKFTAELYIRRMAIII